MASTGFELRRTLVMEYFASRLCHTLIKRTRLRNFILEGKYVPIHLELSRMIERESDRVVFSLVGLAFTLSAVLRQFVIRVVAEYKYFAKGSSNSANCNWGCVCAGRQRLQKHRTLTHRSWICRHRSQACNSARWVRSGTDSDDDRALRLLKYLEMIALE